MLNYMKPVPESSFYFFVEDFKALCFGLCTVQLCFLYSEDL